MLLPNTETVKLNGINGFSELGNITATRVVQIKDNKGKLAGFVVTNPVLRLVALVKLITGSNLVFFFNTLISFSLASLLHYSRLLYNTSLQKTGARYISHLLPEPPTHQIMVSLIKLRFRRALLRFPLVFSIKIVSNRRLFLLLPFHSFMPLKT